VAPDEKKTFPKHAGERKTDQEGDVDESFRGRKGGPDIDVEKREKELERQDGR
jgi:hypothetical protein